jgi:hypothetical protein
MIIIIFIILLLLLILFLYCSLILAKYADEELNNIEYEYKET